MLQWGHAFSDVEIISNIEIHSAGGHWLQWGHAFSDVEIRRRAPASRAVSQLQWGHAFSDVEMSLPAKVRELIVSLQWGHAFSDVEIPRPSRLTSPPPALQWGHAFSDVEICWGDPDAPLHGPGASMGPRLFRRGNKIPAGPQNRDPPLASMGPRLFRRGNFPCCSFCMNARMSFNGATPFQTWK